MSTKKKRNGGWLADTTRRALYFCGHFRCCYCEHSIGTPRRMWSRRCKEWRDAKLTLEVDHVRSHDSHSDSSLNPNRKTNLIVSCGWCNKSKKQMNKKEWSSYLMREDGGLWDGRILSQSEVDEMWKRVDRERKRKVPQDKGREHFQAGLSHEESAKTVDKHYTQIAAK